MLATGGAFAQTPLPANDGPQQDIAASGEQTVRPLSLKEEMVRDRFRRFEDRIYRLREQLGQAEPDNAARLARVLQRAGELGLATRLDEIVDLLQHPATLPKAMESQDDWLSDADRLLAILLERDSDNEARKHELERLREFHQKIGELLERQEAVRGSTGRSAQAARLAQQLDQALRRIDAMLERQQALGEQTQAQGAAGKQLPQDAAAQQTGLAREAQQLAEDLERLSKDEILRPAGNDAKEPTESSADDSALEEARAETAAAAESVQQGSQSMSDAASQMESGDARSAAGPLRDAADALQEARERLEEAKRKLDDQSPSEKLAEEQKQLSEDTEALAQSAAGGQGGESGESDGEQGGEQAGGSDSPTPGQQSLQQAQREMEGATDRLNQSQPGPATRNQDRAIEELEQAQRELEQALEQLRQEEREETLRDLEARFRDMLMRQRVINDATVQLDRHGRENFRRAEELRLAELSTQERGLAQDAAACLHILEEDGTTIVFPRVIDQLSTDMSTVADRLAELKVGVLTQAIQKEIVDTLEQLLEAVQRMQRENQQEQAMQESGGDQPSPLLPPSAELKLLRASQYRVNTRTLAIDEARAEGTEGEPSLKDALQTVARRQIECAETAEEMRASTSQP